MTAAVVAGALSDWACGGSVVAEITSDASAADREASTAADGVGADVSAAPTSPSGDRDGSTDATLAHDDGGHEVEAEGGGDRDVDGAPGDARVRDSPEAIDSSAAEAAADAPDGSAAEATIEVPDGNAAEADVETLDGNIGDGAQATDAAPDSPAVVDAAGCTPPSGGTFLCAPGTCNGASEYCLETALGNSCVAIPAACQCAETFDCTCLLANVASPCGVGAVKCFPEDNGGLLMVTALSCH
jgi:hypothetical protein